MDMSAKYISGWYVLWHGDDGIVTRDKKTVTDFVTNWMISNHMAHTATCGNSIGRGAYSEMIDMYATEIESAKDRDGVRHWLAVFADDLHVKVLDI